MSNELQIFLKDQFEKIKSKNPRFSMRSFARKTQIPVGRMSELMNGKRPLSNFYAERLSERLNLPDLERQVLRTFVSTRSRKLHHEHILTEAEMKILNSWEFYAILNLIKIKGFQGSAEWIATRLGISVKSADQVFSTMAKHKIIVCDHGRWKRTQNHYNTTHDVPSLVLRQALIKDIEISLGKISKVPVAYRDYSSVTLPLNLKNLPAAKKLIESFRSRMIKLLEKGEPTEVYNLNIQLFPLTELPAENETHE